LVKHDELYTVYIMTAEQITVFDNFMAHSNHSIHLYNILCYITKIGSTNDKRGSLDKKYGPMRIIFNY
jgi:hypothetical protein